MAYKPATVQVRISEINFNSTIFLKCVSAEISGMSKDRAEAAITASGILKLYWRRIIIVCSMITEVNSTR